MVCEWLLKLFKTDNTINEIAFKCTKRQVDKVFYSLAFAACSSTIRCARLYCVVRKPSGVVGSVFSVNTFNVKDPFYRLVYQSECSRLPVSPYDPPHLEAYRNV